MRSRRPVLLVIAAWVLAALSGCGSSSQTTQTVTVIETVTVPAGVTETPTGPNAPARLEAVPGQPALDPYSESVGFIATDAVAIRTYGALERVYRARAHFFGEGRECIGVTRPACFRLLLRLGAQVAAQRDAAALIALSADPYSTPCGGALKDFYSSIIQLYDGGVEPYANLSGSSDSISAKAVRETTADADAAFNEGLYQVRLACGEAP